MVLVILSVFGSILTPTIQSTVPLIADDIKKTNILVSQTTSIIAMISPALAGLLYSIFQFRVIIWFVCLSFLLTAFLECFLKITGEKYLADSKKEVCNFKEVLSFFCFDGKEILYLILFAGIISFFVTGLINVGIPYLIKSVLKMNTVAFGFCETASGIAAVIGTTCSPIIIKKLKLKNLYLLIIGVGLSIGGVGIGSIDISVTYIRYFEILFFVCLIHFLISIFSVTSLSVIMERTPNRFLGRILSFVATLTICLQPLGQIMYGLGLSYSSIKNFVFLVMISILTIIVSIYSRKMFHKLFK